MGEVYLARDQRLRRHVALKLLPSDARVEGLAAERFQREARALASLNHPNICAIYDIGEDRGTPYIVLEYLKGETLAQRLTGDDMPLAVAGRYASQIADALRAAHRAGVLHRDVKPSNIMLVDTGIKLLDFGISRFLAHSDSTTKPGRVTLQLDKNTLAGVLLGTLPYMPPEQVTGDAVDQRGDIYAFGAVLYEMLSGGPPFTAGDNDALIRAIRTEQARPLSALRRDVPSALDALVLRCLSKEVHSRWGSFEEVLGALHNALPNLEPKGVRRRRTALSRRHIRSIAVLPFRCVQRVDTDEYLADGLTELLISRIATISSLRVISRTSAIQYRDTREALPVIAARLNVESIIEGSVQCVGGRVRVTARLIEAASDGTLWSDTFDRPFEDVLAIQSEIAEEISQHVSGTLSASERRALRRWTRVPHDAQDAYLRARFLWNKHEAHSLHKSFEYYQTALALAPEYPLAHSGMADWYHLAALSRLLPHHDAFKNARASAGRALALDSQLADARATLARLSHLEWDWAGAEQGFHRVVNRHPSCFNARLWYAAFLSHCGRYIEALEQVREAATLDPLNPRVYETMAFCHCAARNFKAAEGEATRATELQGDSANAHYVSGLALSFLDRADEAIAEFDLAARFSHEHPSTLVGRAACLWRAGRRAQADDALARIQQSAASAYDRAEAFAACDRLNEALTCLGSALDERLPELVGIGAEPLLDPLRSQAVFQQMIDRVGVPRPTSTELPLPARR